MMPAQNIFAQRAGMPGGAPTSTMRMRPQMPMQPQQLTQPQQAMPTPMYPGGGPSMPQSNDPNLMALRNGTPQPGAPPGMVQPMHPGGAMQPGGGTPPGMVQPMQGQPQQPPQYQTQQPPQYQTQQPPLYQTQQPPLQQAPQNFLRQRLGMM